jgi:drug/metabolite transporter (DMT)-like permease
VTATPATGTDTGPDTASRRRADVALAAAVLAMAALSLGPSIVKSSDLKGLHFAFYRLWTAAILYVTLTVVRRRPLTTADLRLSWRGGLLFGLNIGCFFVSAKLTSVANVSVISALQPALTLVILAVAARAWPRPTTTIWTLVAIGGLAVSVMAGANAGTGDPVGDALAVGTMVLSTAYYFASKTARLELDTVTYTAGMLLVASVVLSPIAVVGADSLSWPPAGDWPLILLMVLIPGTGHALTNYAHGYVPMTVMSLIALLAPVFSALYAWVLIDEHLGWVQIAGMAVVLVALAIVVTTEQHARTPARSTPTPTPASESGDRTAT